MIEIPRRLAQLLRAVLRHSVVARGPRAAWPPLLGRADGHGLHLQAQGDGVAVAYHQSGALPADALAFRSSLLGQLEGRTQDVVRLEQRAPGQGRASWQDGSVPRVLDFETTAPDSLPPFPVVPKQLHPLPAALLGALHEAARTTASEAARYALSQVFVRGQAGQVVATDGKQLLIQGGCRFPWTEDVLVPRVAAFGLRELQGEGTVGVGRTATHVVLRSGSWTFCLAIDTTGRFPDVQAVLPKPATLTGHLTLPPEDAAFLREVLRKLPGQQADPTAVTLDLDRQVLVRVPTQSSAPLTEVLLARSTVTGAPVRLAVERAYLQRALQLGFTELSVGKPEAPLLWHDPQRQYVFLPLDPAAVLPPTADAVRLASSDSPIPERSKTVMPTPPANTSPGNGKPTAGSDPSERPLPLEDLIAEADALRTVLQDASARVVRLLGGLKQHRRQSRAVRQAVQSLRQLKLDG